MESPIVENLEGLLRGDASKNISEGERALSIAGGALLAGWGLRHLLSGRGLLAVSAGGALLYRGLSGYCALYDKLGVQTCTMCAAGNEQGSEIGQQSRPRMPEYDDAVSEATEESFPASDAPSWTGSTVSRGAPQPPTRPR